jgi:hypothetical protein
LAHRRWLAGQKFEHPAQQIGFQDAVDATENADARLRRLDEQLCLGQCRRSTIPAIKPQDYCNLATSWPLDC